MCWFWLLLCAIVIFVALAGIGAPKRRSMALAAAAKALRMKYSPGDPLDLTFKYALVSAFNRGTGGHAYNTIHGTRKGFHTVVVDYEYTEGAGMKNSHTATLTYCIITVDKQLPDLQLRPENFLDTIKSWAGVEDIDFESKEFSDAFYVKCNDKKAAYDFIHPRMMEYLLRNRKIHLETSGKIIIVYYWRTVAAREVGAFIDTAQGIARLLPTYM